MTPPAEFVIYGLGTCLFALAGAIIIWAIKEFLS